MSGKSIKEIVPTATTKIALAVNVVAFGRRDGALYVLVIRRKREPFPGQWALPGGFVDLGEPCELAAGRGLLEGTGVCASGFQQVGAYMDSGRDPRKEQIGSVAYATVFARMPEPVPGEDASEALFILVSDVLNGAVELAFDHPLMVRDACRRLPSLGYVTSAMPMYTLSTGEVADAFGVDRKTVVQWTEAGKLRCIRTPGGQRRYHELFTRFLLTGKPTYTIGNDGSAVNGWFWECRCHNRTAGRFETYEVTEKACHMEHQVMAEAEKALTE